MQLTCNCLLFNVVIALSVLVQNSLGGIISLNNDEMSTTISMITELPTETTPLQIDTTESSLEQTTLYPELTTAYQAQAPSTAENNGDDYQEYKFLDHLVDLLFVMHDFYILTDSTLSTGLKLFEDVITDVSNSGSNDASARSKITELQQFVEEIKQYNPVRHFEFSKESDINILQNFIDILAKCNATALNEPSEGDFLIDNSLKQHGLLPIEREFDESFGAYQSRYQHELGKFFETLAHSEPETAEDEQLKAWLIEMKYLATKIERFAQYFHENSI